MKKVISSIIFIILFMFTCTLTIHAESNDVYNVVTCPGENMATQMQINWQTPTAITKMALEYTKATDPDFVNETEIKADYKVFERVNKGNVTFVGMETPRHVWSVIIDGLTPETEYIYRLTGVDKVYPNIYKFKTASLENKDFSFLFMTDPQYYSDTGAQRFNDMAEKHINEDNIEFAFLTGDITDRGGNSDLWAMFFDKSSIAKIPYVTTVGNHEYYDSGTVTLDNSIYNNFFYNPQNGPEHLKGSSYYTLYNGVLFVMLDSEDNDNLVEQQTWFKEVCKSVNARYIIVGAHRSPYAGANYFRDGQIFIQRWGKLFDELAVDLVLTGHDHMYARTKNLYDSKVCNEKYKGTTYILGGSAGLKYYPQTRHDNESLWAKWFEMTTSSTVITVEKENLKIKTVSYGGEVLDKATIPAKRFGEVDKNFTKSDFEKSLIVTVDSNDKTSGTISFDSRGYGLVNYLEFVNTNNGEIIGGTPLLNNKLNSYKIDGGFLNGELNKILVNITYVDKTTNKVYIEADSQIDWGTITNIRITEVKSDSITFTWDQDINSDYRFIKNVQIYRDGNKAKNVALAPNDLEKDEYSVTLNRSLEPNTIYTFVVEIQNINGNPVLSKEFRIKMKNDMTIEEEYQDSLGSLAIKAAIDNILKALGK